MKNLSALLERISRSLDRNTSNKEIVIRVVMERTNISLKKDKISIKGGVLEINVSSVARSEIKFREEEVLSDLRDNHKLFITRVMYI